MRLETDRLLLRSFADDDYDAVHEYATDLEVVRYMVWGPNTEQDTREFLERAQAQAAKEPRTVFGMAIVEKASGLLVGGVGIDVAGAGAPQASLGYCLHRKAWGRGIATESAREMMRFGFAELGLRRIWAGCDPDNAGSSHVLEKLGMQLEGRLRQDSLVQGEWRDTLVYGILAPEWEGAAE